MAQDDNKPRVKVSDLSIYDAPRPKVAAAAVATEPNNLDVAISRTREAIWRVSDAARSVYRGGGNVVRTVNSSPELQNRLGIVVLSGAAGLFFAGARAGRIQRSAYGLAFSGCATMTLWPKETKEVTRNSIAAMRQYYERTSAKRPVTKVEPATPIASKEDTQQLAVSHESAETPVVPEEQSQTPAVVESASAEEAVSSSAGTSKEAKQQEVHSTEDHGQSDAEDSDMYANRSG